MPPIIRYPLDKTGISPANLVQGEQCTLNNRPVRIIAPHYGAYFDESVVMVDLANNHTLVRDVDWYPGELCDAPTALTGKGVYSIIVITNTAISNTVLLNYQAIGGEFSISADAIANLINNLSLDARPVDWPSLIHKPATYPPSQHLHDAGDIYGFEYLVHALERLRTAIEFGDMLSHNDIYQYIDQKNALLSNAISTATEVTEDVAYFMGGSSN